jgi:hypothetical protein
MRLTRSKVSIVFSFVALVAIVVALGATGVMKSATTPKALAAPTSSHYTLNCAVKSWDCTEVQNPEKAFGWYVGHDEPATLFYSNTPGSGNQMQYNLTLPSDPPPQTIVGRSYNFELHIAFWFGMAMCDTQSFPELLSTCTPDSDTNISDPAVTPAHAGTAFMEMQFYPPGYVLWPAGNSCDPTKWCAALNIDSLLENPVTGQVQNTTCQAQLGTIETVNFAFITKNGKSQAPANPIQATTATYTPNPTQDLFMSSGDHVAVTMHDTSNGLNIALNDQTSGQSGSMTASAANGFGQVKFDPTGTSCTNIPYNFHPMYSTSSEKTRVTWAAHSYNIAFSDEIGHFDYCSQVDTTTGTCTGTEGLWHDQEPADSDDTYCFTGSQSSLIQLPGCLGENDPGFDGASYQTLWPDGNYSLHPTPVQFSSPLTGSSYNVQYNRMAFETDLPAIESLTTCDVLTGTGCTLTPQTDDGFPATFYPFFSDTKASTGCVWQIGNHIPGDLNDFKQNQEYGTLLGLTYTNTGGGPFTAYEDYRQVLSSNPCPV